MSILAVLSRPAIAVAQSPGSNEESPEPTLAQELSSTPVRGQSGVSATLGFKLQDGRTEAKGWEIDGIASHTTQRRQLIRFDVEISSSKVRLAENQPFLQIDDNHQFQGLFLQPIRRRISGIALGGWRRDAILGLDYRASVGGGIGLHIVESRRANLLFAPTFVAGKEHRRHTDQANDVVDFGFLQSFVGRVTPVLSIEEWWQTNVDTSDSADKASTFNVSAIARITRHISWKLYYKQQYDGLVPRGQSNSQREIGTAMVIAFARLGEAAKAP